MEDWRRYEERVYDKLRSEFPDHDIERDARVRGRMSGIDRQVDVVIRRQVAGYDFFGAVECRKLSRPLDVTAVDRFAGFLKDIGANFGILFTTQGSSEAARSRAEHADMKLDIVDFRDIDEYHFQWDLCEMCDAGPDRPPQAIEFDAPVAVVKDGVASTAQIGWCTWCNGITIKCWVCGEITPIWEREYDLPLECRGGCGLRFTVKTEYVDHYLEERVEILGFD